MKKSFILHNDSLCVLEDLTNEQRGELFYAISKYQVDGEIINLSPIVKIAFSPFKNQFNRDFQKYEEFCKQQQEKGKKGGRPKKPKETQKTQRVIGKPKKANNDSDSDSDKDSKSKYGEHKNVLLTEKENNKLKEKFLSKYQEVIESFSTALAMKGYVYKSHYLAILKWNKNSESQKDKIILNL